MIKGETKSGGNTAARVGGLFQEIAAELEQKSDKVEMEQLVENLEENKLDKTGIGDDVSVTFSQTEERENIFSGEKLSVLWGKVCRWLADLKDVAFSGKLPISNKTQTTALSVTRKNRIGILRLTGFITT